MRVLLVCLEERHPAFKGPPWTPVYLPSLAAALRAKGHQAAIVERFAFQRPGVTRRNDDFAARFARIAAAFAPDALVFEVELESWGFFRRLAPAAREAAPSALLLAGGRHVTQCPDETLQFCPELDAALIGEAEGAVCEIAGGSALPDVAGLAVRSGSGAARTAEAPLIEDLDALPLPAWDLLDMEYYARRTPRVIPCIPLRTVSIEGSRGCSGTCEFCTEGRAHARVHRFHSPEYIADEIGMLIREYAVEGIYFRDENFLANRDRVAALCETLARRGPLKLVRWSAQVRTDTVCPEILRLMRDGGCIQIEYGIESGSQRVLDSIAKGTNVAQNLEAIRITREAGLRSLAYVMYGLPGETREDLAATAAFLDAAGPDIVRFNRFIVYPGSPMARKLIQRGLLDAHFWRDPAPSPASSGRGIGGVAAMTPSELRSAAGGIYRRRLFPLLLRDFATHNRLRDIACCFNVTAAARLFLGKLLR